MTLPPELVEAVARVAVKEDRNRARTIEIAVREYVQARGETL